MYLKQLDLLGFKSFANKTTVHFSSGMTAIVGPNGCGKTNVLDALRWVLGEQKVTLLRGSKMEEVIFNGTREVKPLGMAEVSLRLVNNRGVLPTEYRELQITRRLFRSGESEYLLNKVPCRRKDITELFFDTGMGAHSYSVIQQDMIDAVISDKAEERRFLFEEAAGITKYKQRKRAALRKLEATENDFLRLKDIYAEVQTQVRSLKRQYKKAERYQRVANEIKGWELYLSSSRLRALEQEKRQVQADLDGASDQLLERQSELDSVSATIESDRRRQIELESRLAEVGNEAYEITERAHGQEKEVSILTEKRSNARSLIERNESDIDGLQRRSELIDQQINEADTELADERETQESLAEELKHAEAVQAEADRRLLSARSAKEQENQQLTELEGRIASGKTEETHLREQDAELSEQVMRAESEMETGRSHLERLQSDLRSRQSEIEQITGNRDSKRTELQTTNDQIETLQQRSEELADELSRHAASIEACEARRNLLKDMILHYEGYASGVVSLMEESERWPGVIGTVADKFVPVEGLEVAVESALGEMSGFVICSDRGAAEEVIGYLRSEKKGRVGILVPDTGTLNPIVKRPEIQSENFVGWLDSFVSSPSDLKPLMQAVLSRVAVFEADTDPSEILTQLPFGFKAVATNGVVYSNNMIRGGSDDSLSLFRRQEKVDEQKKLLEQLTRKQAEARQARDEVARQLAGRREAVSTLTVELETLQTELEQVGAAAKETEYECRTLESQIHRLTVERDAARAKLESIKNRQYSLELDFGQLADRKQTLVSAMSAASEQLDSLDRAASDALEEVSRLQMAAVEARSRVDQIVSKISHLQELRQEISNTIATKKAENERAVTEIEESSARIAELEEAIKSTFESRQEVNARQSALRTDQAGLMETLEQGEKRLKGIRAEKESLSDQVHQKEIRLTTIASESSSIEERVREEYDLDIRSVAVNKPDDEMPDDQARSHLAEKKEVLKKFGAVNLLALEEYETAAEREKFLSEQLSDLEAAKTDLKTTINKINHTARRLFVETFEQARTNFRKLFVELFSGGEADIRLEDPNDPLESAIEIVARPRGKKVLSITMMSGGERALTSIALLFSLYMVKPSPFCILDEIDAPLDDANCRRFLRILGSFSGQTQFIIITHNKITMEAADNLYGITMDQPGISQLVAVRFVEGEGDGGVRLDRVTDDESGSTGVLATPADDPGNGDKPSPTESPSGDKSGYRADEDDMPDSVRERMSANLTVSDESDEDS